MSIYLFPVIFPFNLFPFFLIGLSEPGRYCYSVYKLRLDIKRIEVLWI